MVAVREMWWKEEGGGQARHAGDEKIFVIEYTAGCNYAGWPISNIMDQNINLLEL